MADVITKTIETEKIVVEPEYDLIDVLAKIEQSQAVRLILTFAEKTDILISPINLKVILDVADENKKIIIAQIIQNVSGVRNAKDAGVTVTDATGTVLDILWSEAEQGFKSRMKAKDLRLQKRMERKAEVQKEPVKPEPVIEPEPKIEKIKIKEGPKEEKEQPVIIDEKPQEKSEFAKRIDETLQRAKQESLHKQGKVVEKNGITLALDRDVNEPQETKTPEPMKAKVQAPSLIGKDLAYFKVNDMQDPEEETTEIKKRGVKKPTFDFKGIFSKLPKFENKGLASLGLKIILPLVLVLVLVFALTYYLAPLAKVKIYVTSKEVSVEKVFTGPVGSQVFSYEDGVIPVKREELTKDASGSTTPTGTAYKGTKAEGVVTLTYWKFLTNGGQPTTVPVGTIISTSSGIKYETLTAAKVGTTTPLSMTADVAIRAVAVGSEYNLAAGQPPMTVAGYTGAEMTAQNSAAISGGAKEAYTVLSQSDVDKVVTDIKKGVMADLRSELDLKKEGGWEIIDSTVKQELDGDPKTDIPVGGEGTVANINIKVKASALYYQKSEIESKVSEVLTKSAQEQNLFNNDEGLKLQMENNITQSITIDSVKNDIVKLRLKASGRIKPEINKEEIVNSLKGKSWKDGIKKLEDFIYSEKPTEVEFSPSYFPEFLKHFPKRQGRILLTIVDTQ